jgi:hypothetical protein
MASFCCGLKGPTQYPRPKFRTTRKKFRPLAQRRWSAGISNASNPFSETEPSQRASLLPQRRYTSTGLPL